MPRHGSFMAASLVIVPKYRPVASSRSFRTRASKMSSHPIWRKARMPPRISEVLETRASLVCKHFLSKLDDLEEN